MGRFASLPLILPKNPVPGKAIIHFVSQKIGIVSDSGRLISIHCLLLQALLSGKPIVFQFKDINMKERFHRPIEAGLSPLSPAGLLSELFLLTSIFVLSENLSLTFMVELILRVFLKRSELGMIPLFRILE